MDLKRKYLFDLINDVTTDCVQMKKLKDSNEDIAKLTIHVTYCDNILNWKDCEKCQ